MNEKNSSSSIQPTLSRSISQQQQECIGVDILSSVEVLERTSSALQQILCSNQQQTLDHKILNDLRPIFSALTYFSNDAKVVTSSENLFSAIVKYITQEDILDALKYTSDALRCLEIVSKAQVLETIATTDSIREYLVTLNMHCSLSLEGIMDISQVKDKTEYRYHSWVFAGVSIQLSIHLKFLEENSSQWESLDVEDPLIKKNIFALKDMQTQIKRISRFLNKGIPPKSWNTCQVEREGLIESTQKLITLFEDLETYLGSEEIPWRIFDDINTQFDNLCHHTKYLLTWLSDLISA